MLITRLDSVDSTNTYLADMARRGAPAGSIVTARRQTAGRGRAGRSFLSPEGGLYLSLLLRPVGSFEPGLITARAAVAVCRALDALGVDGSGIKWVNDIILREKKICGILAEAVQTPQGLAVIVGLGINVSTPAEYFEGELAGKAGSILSICSAVPDIDSLASELISQLRSEPDPAADLEFYRSRCINMHREILVSCGKETYTARALGIEPDYALRIEHEGRKELLRFGEASVRGDKGQYI